MPDSIDEVEEVLSARWRAACSSTVEVSVRACSSYPRMSGVDSVGDKTRNLLPGWKGADEGAERTRKRPEVVWEYILNGVSCRVWTEVG